MTITLATLLALTALLWAALLFTLHWMQTGDPLGRRIAESFGIYAAIGVWSLLACALVVTALQTHLPLRVTVGALGLVALSFAATCVAIRLFGDHAAPRWLVVVPALPPLLIGALGVAALFGNGKSFVTAPSTHAWLAFVLIALSALPWPSAIKRSEANAAETERLESLRAAKH
jgi:hypothetical protein